MVSLYHDVGRDESWSGRKTVEVSLHPSLEVGGEWLAVDVGIAQCWRMANGDGWAPKSSDISG